MVKHDGDTPDDAKMPDPASGSDLTHWIFGSLGRRGRVRGSIRFDVERIDDASPEPSASAEHAPDEAHTPEAEHDAHREVDRDFEFGDEGEDASEASSSAPEAEVVEARIVESGTVESGIIESGDDFDARDVVDVEFRAGDRPPVLAECEDAIDLSSGVGQPFLHVADADTTETRGATEPQGAAGAAKRGAQGPELESRADFLAWLDSLDELPDARRPEPAGGAKDAEEEQADEEDECEDALVVGDFEAPTEQRFVATILESMLVLGLIVCGELAITGEIGSYGVHPHPYWLVVIPMAAGRGVVGALIAAGSAAFAYAIGARAAHAGDFMAVLDARVMQEAMLFFAVGFVVGEFRDAGRRTWRALWNAFAKQEQELELLRREKELLAEANHAIKRRLVDNAGQFGNLIRTATRLEAADEVELFDVALEMIEEHCGATRCAMLAVLEGGLLDLAAYRGYEEGQLRELLAGAESSPLVAKVLETGRRLNGFGASEDIVGDGPIVVCPIADASGVVRQLLCLDRIPVRAFNDSTVMTFYGIADWVAVTLRRASNGSTHVLDFRLGLREAISIGPWVGSAAQLGERIRIEDARCSRQGILSAAVSVQCIGVPEERSDEVEAWVLDQLMSDLRPTDGLYRFGYPGCFLFVLSGTDELQCQIVRQRVEDRIARFEDRCFDAWKTGAFAPDTECPDLRSLLPRIAEHFREHSEYALDSELPVSVDDRIEIGRLDDFVRRVRTEWSIAIRNEVELYVLEFRDDTADAKRGNVLARHVEAVSRELLRPTDGVYRSAVARFSIILPGSSCEGAFAALARFLESLEQRASRGVIEAVEAQVYALGSDYEQYERFLARMLGENLSSSATGEGEGVGVESIFDDVPVVAPQREESAPQREEAAPQREEAAPQREETSRDAAVEAQLDSVLHDPFAGELEATVAANATEAVEDDEDFELIIDDESFDVLDELFGSEHEARGSVDAIELPPAEERAPSPERGALDDGLDALASLRDEFTNGGAISLDELVSFDGEDTIELEDDA